MVARLMSCQMMPRRWTLFVNVWCLDVGHEANTQSLSDTSGSSGHPNLKEHEVRAHLGSFGLGRLAVQPIKPLDSV